MTQSESQKQMSPVNIDQNRAVGQDSPVEGSRMGREANKVHGLPGEAEQAADARSEGSTADLAPQQISRENAIRNAAYEAYQRRGGMPGSEADDWLAAEAQVDRQKID